MRLTLKKEEFKQASLDLKAQFIIMGILMPLMGIGFGLLLFYSQFFGHEVPTKNELFQISGNVTNYSFDRQGIRNDYNTIIYLDNYDNGFIVRGLTKDITHNLFGNTGHESVSFLIDEIRKDKINSEKSVLTYGLSINGKIINRLERELERDNDAQGDFDIIGLILIFLSLILYRKYLNRIISEQSPAANKSKRCTTQNINK